MIIGMRISSTLLSPERNDAEEAEVLYAMNACRYGLLNAFWKCISMFVQEIDEKIRFIHCCSHCCCCCCFLVANNYFYKFVLNTSKPTGRSLASACTQLLRIMRWDGVADITICRSVCSPIQPTVTLVRCILSSLPSILVVFIFDLLIAFIRNSPIHPWSHQ